MKFSVRQILASAAGAVLAALIASAFGVKGTIVGVAIGSAAATTGTALVAQSIQRGHDAVKQVVVRPEAPALLRKLGGTGAAGESASSVEESAAPTEAVAATTSTSGDAFPMAMDPASDAVTEPIEMPTTTTGPKTEQLRSVVMPSSAASLGTATSTAGRYAAVPKTFSWKAIAATAGIVFVLALLFVTSVELIAGKPLSAIFGHGGTGTSLNNVVNPPSSPATTATTTTTTTTSSTSTTTSSTSTTTTAPGATTTTTTAPSPSTTTTTGLGATTTTTTVPLTVTLP